MTFLQFADKSVPYAKFIEDVASRVVNLLRSDNNDPEYISQRKAYAMFGRSNVERWRRCGKIRPCKRPGKLEYCTAELRLLQRTRQDYLNR